MSEFKNRKPAPKKENGNNKPKPPAMSARKLALYALSDVVTGGAYSGLALSDRLKKASLSPDDRRLATSIFYAALENRLRISYVLKQFVHHMPEPIVEQILHIAAAQLLFMDKLPDFAVVNEAVEQARTFNRLYFAPLINGTLRNLIRARDAGEIEYPSREANPVRYLSVQHSINETLVARLVEAYGLEETEAILSYRAKERWETIRPNLLRADEKRFEELLTRRGWTFRRGPVPMSWQIQGAGSLAEDNAFTGGVFSIQTPSSMLAALAVDPKPGMKILDACAAPGGKSALMAEKMGDTGRVFAYELHEHRVDLIRAYMKRLGLTNVRPVQADATVLREAQIEQMDAVLLDVPCSGLGMMADKPDIKFRMHDEDLISIVETQKKILRACSQYVRPGGTLVYSTCTILPMENQQQVLAFLEEQGDFELDNSADWLPEEYRPRFENGMIQFLPHKDEGMSGFFIARMRRKTR